MTHTKTTIRSAIHRLVTDREYCMNIGAIAKTGARVAACTILRRELDWTLRHPHNAHTALVRRNADRLKLLANSIHAKQALKNEVLTMVNDLTNNNNYDTTIHHEQKLQTAH